MQHTPHSILIILLFLFSGGVFISEQDFSFFDSTFNGNSATFGGGLCGIDSAVNASLQNVIFASNYASSNGGGAYLQDITATVRVANCSFTDNNVDDIGGALFFNGNIGRDFEFDALGLTYFVFDEDAWSEAYYDYEGVGGVELRVVVEESVFSGNRAHSGGAMYSKDVASLVVTSSSFQANEASQDGGAAAYYGASATTSFLDTWFDGNVAVEQGGEADHHW